MNVTVKQKWCLQMSLEKANTPEGRKFIDSIPVKWTLEPRDFIEAGVLTLSVLEDDEIDAFVFRSWLESL